MLVELVTKKSDPLETQWTMLRSPALFVCFRIKPTIATDPVCGIHIDFAHQIGQLTIPRNKTLLPGFHFPLIVTLLLFLEVHGAYATRFQ